MRNSFVGSPRLARVLFVAGLALTATGLLSAPWALLTGLACALSVGNPWTNESRRAIPAGLKCSVVALGFGMNLRAVLLAGRSGLLYSFGGIALAMLLGLGLSRWLEVKRTPAFLIAAGTAICGGSAIAALGPIVDAGEEEMAVALGAVFILNGIALLLFPPIGHGFGLSQTQFGLWAALAIHDTSSVVGATVLYGPQAIEVGTAVKLARALWIVPLALATARFAKRKTNAARLQRGIRWPWFIGFFCLAALANSLWPRASSAFNLISHAGRLGLAVTLFLIGAGLSRETIARVGFRPLLLGVLLWMVVGAVTLSLILAGAIHL